MTVHSLTSIGEGKVKVRCGLEWKANAVPPDEAASAWRSEVTCDACFAGFKSRAD